MTEKTKQTIQEQINLLPKELQEVISTSNWEKLTEEIGKKYLTKEEISDLQKEVILILLGFEFLELLAENIECNIKTTKEESISITKELSEKIFTPFFEKLEEKIKEKIENKKIKWYQNIDFILSGGDYTSFLERPGENNQLDNIQINQLPTNNSKLEDLKNKFTI